MVRFEPAVYSTLSAEAVGRVVEASYALGQVTHCRLIHHGRNDVYELRRASGERCIVRVGLHRRDRLANVAYELALVAHLKRAGAPVATALPNNRGDLSIEVAAIEGARTLVIFDLLQGEAPGENLADFTLMGAGLARIHALAEGYLGPSSALRLDLDHLVRRPLTRVLSLPTVDDSVREDLTNLAAALVREVEARKGLSMVTCHGDFCGPNVLVDELPSGERFASFFDFEESGPGYLAYELATFLWAELVQTDTLALTDVVQERWKRFLDGYRQVRPIVESDLEAVGRFVLARHYWWMGEVASHVDEVGTQDMPPRWLRAQVATLRAWWTIQPN